MTTPKSNLGLSTLFLTPLSYIKNVVPKTLLLNFPTKPSVCRDKSVGSQLIT